MSHSNESSSPDAIPVLSEVIVHGDPAQGRDVPELVDILPDEPGFARPPAAERDTASPYAAAEPAAAASQAQAASSPAPSSAPAAAMAPAPAAPATPDYDANLLAERLRGRFASFLTGEGRTLIEARCRDAIQEHNAWLVGQVTREVAMLLETEVSVWIREAIREELKQRGDV
jgi:pyruvate/2-oxoglutarate dehydrogenase complex dihydrolipoamide acyltransferase (E2) component